jgi:hypothetical protein
MYHMPLSGMAWQVHFHDEFKLEELPEKIQDELLARLRVLSEFGPHSLGDQMSIRLKAHPSQI